MNIIIVIGINNTNIYIYIPFIRYTKYIILNGEYIHIPFIIYTKYIILNGEYIHIYAYYIN